MIKKLVHKYFTLKTLQCLCCVGIILLLSACEKDDQTSVGGDENFNKQAACWQTKIIEVVLSQINNIFTTSAAQVADGGGALVMLGFAIWMAFKILKILPSFKEENLGEVWTEIGQKLFLCAFCAWAVSDTGMIQWTVQTFAVPIYNTILELGADVLGQQRPSQTISLGDYGSVTFSGNYNKCTTSELSASNLRGSIEPLAGCLTCQISDRLNGGVRVGISLITSLDLGGMFVGLIMMLIFTAAKFGFIFFIIDGLFRLNFAVLLFPLLIMGVPFGFTRKWSKHGFLMFLNSSGVMMFLGVLVSISVGALEYILRTFSNNGDFKEENLIGQGPILLSLLLISTLLINIPGMGVALADKFIGGGGGLEFQKQVSKFVINSAKRAGAAILGGITAGATKTITTTLEKYEASREALDSIKQVKGKINNKLDKLAGYNDD